MTIVSLSIKRFGEFGTLDSEKNYPVFVGTEEECAAYCEKAIDSMAEGKIVKVGNTTFTINCIDYNDECGVYYTTSGEYLDFTMADVNAMTVE